MALVRSELTKVLSTRLWWGLLIGVAVYAAVNAGLSAGFAGVDPGAGQPAAPALDEPVALRSVYAGAAFSGAYLFALVLGVTGMTGEHRYRTDTPTYLATPRRERVVLAKAGAHLLVGLAYGALAVVVAGVVGAVVVAARGYPLGLSTPGLPRAVALGLLAVALWTLLGLGVGTLIRNQVAAILVGIAVAMLLEPLLGLALHAADLDAVARVLPSAASAAMTGSTSTVDLLPWWGGAAVMLAWASAFAGIGLALTVRRDIT